MVAVQTTEQGEDETTTADDHRGYVDDAVAVAVLEGACIGYMLESVTRVVLMAWDRFPSCDSCRIHGLMSIPAFQDKYVKLH